MDIRILMIQPEGGINDEEAPYAAILLDRVLNETVTYPVDPLEIARKTEDKTISDYDRQPKTKLYYHQPLIVFDTEKDFIEGNGRYQEYGDDWFESCSWEYGSMMVDLETCPMLKRVWG